MTGLLRENKIQGLNYFFIDWKKLERGFDFCCQKFRLEKKFVEIKDLKKFTRDTFEGISSSK